MTMTYDREASIAAGEQAQDRAEANADKAWLVLARQAVRRTAQNCSEFTADDVWEFNELVGTRENRTIGPVMRWAQNQGLIASTERFESSRNVGHHGSPKRIWRSRIYERKS